MKKIIHLFAGTSLALLVVLGHAQGANAAIGYVQSASAQSSTSATSVSKAFISANAQGNLIVAAISFDSSGGTAWSCSDSQGNSYSQATFINDSRVSQAL